MNIFNPYRFNPPFTFHWVDSYYNNSSDYRQIAATDDYLYITDTGTFDRILINSVDGSGNITQIGTHTETGINGYYHIQTNGTFLFLTTPFSGLFSFEINQIDGSLTKISSNYQGVVGYELLVVESLIFVSSGNDGIFSYSADTNGNLTFVDSDNQGGTYRDLCSDGNYIYVTCQNAGIRTYSFDSSGNLTYVSVNTYNTNHWRIDNDSNFIYATNPTTNILTSYSADTSGNLTEIDDISVNNGYDVITDGNYIYVTHVSLDVYSADALGNLSFVNETTPTDTVVTSNLARNTNFIFVTQSQKVYSYENYPT